MTIETPPAAAPESSVTPPAASTPPAETPPPSSVTPPATPPAAAPPAGGDAPKAFDFASELTRFAGDDKGKINNLRYKSLDDALEALHNAKTKIREGSLRKPLAADATPEQIAEYREANGIPDKPEGYFEKLPDGLVIGDEDKRIFDSFAKSMHAKNVDPSVVHETIKWYNEFAQQEEAAALERNLDAKTKVEDQFMKEWGADFPANKNLISNIVATMPKELVGEGEEPGPLFLAELPDGTQLMNHPAMISMLVEMGKKLHMPSTPLAPGNSPTGQTDEARRDELVKMSGNHDGPYWKGPNAVAMQNELVSLNERIAKRSGGG